jgi:beta-glucosidase
MMSRLAIGGACILLVCTALHGAVLAQPVLGSHTKPQLSIDGLTFRDLNSNGRLDPYEDWRLSAQQRADDLVARMTREDKAGALLHPSAPIIPAAGMNDASRGYDLASARSLIATTHVLSLHTSLAVTPDRLAAENNKLQEIAESTRLGIPLTLSSEIRNRVPSAAGAAALSHFTQWPDNLGLAAIGDAALVRRLGDIARQEYRAVGIHMGLSPQADLATEPRWARVAGTFGENAKLTSRMVEAYVEGFQGGRTGLHRDSVAVIVKHFAGYGAAKDGWDAQSYYGRYAAFAGGRFDEHVGAFRGAFAAKAAGVMSMYSVISDQMVDGRLVEQVGGGYNRWLLTDVLRKREGFEGLVLSDFGITDDCPQRCREGAPAGEVPGAAGPLAARGRGWGVAELSKPERFAKGLSAGLDMFGGTSEAEYLLAALDQGLVSENRIDESVRRMLQIKFELGLFENPFVDPAAAAAFVGNSEFRAEGEAAQRLALVLLENRGALLPLKTGTSKVFLSGIDPEAARRAGLQVAERLEDAQVAIIRAATPFQRLHPGFAIGGNQHEGDLDFKPDDPTFALIQSASQKVPTIVVVMLDRPAILTNVKPLARALIGSFGASDDALLDVIAGRAKAAGHLPFELPSSMNAVRAQKSDVASDSRDPLYRFGFGLRTQ